MTELVVISDGGPTERDGVGDTQQLIDDGFGWTKLKRNRNKLLVVGLIVVVIVSCVITLSVTLSASSNADQHSSAADGKVGSVGHTPKARTHALSNKQRYPQKISTEYRNSNEGRQFAIAFPIVRDTDYTNYYECCVITRQQTTIEIRSQYLGLDNTVSVAAGGNHTVSFNESIRTTGGIENKAVYIHADSDIIVQCAGRYNYYMDSFLVLPFRDDYTEFYIAVCADSYSTSLVGFVNVVSTADDTVLNITCPTSLSECPGTNYAVELSRNMTYSLYVARDSELTGFYIKASNPISVYTGSPNLRLHEGSDFNNNQFLTFAVPPRQQLGTLHYAPETTGDPARNHRLRIVATDDTTVIISRYGVNATLEQFEFYTQDYSYYDGTSGPFEVWCSTPCIVIHCNKEHQTDSYAAYMMRVTPIEAFTDDILFSSVPYFGFQINHYLSIVVNQYPVTDIYLDGNSLSAEEWMPNESGDYAGLMLSVTPDMHRIKTSSFTVKFAAYSLGNKGSDKYCGYGSQAGVGDGAYVQDDRQPPAYHLAVWGNFSSFDGEDFSMECGAGYSEELALKADNMMMVLNDIIGLTLCSKLTDDEVVVVFNINRLTTSGPNGETLVAYTLNVDRELKFEQVHICGAEITTYLLDHENWGIPLLPPIVGCPFPVFDPPEFYDYGSEWICDPSISHQSFINTINVPGYDVTIDSNFTTFTGEDLSTECSDKYIVSLNIETTEMLADLDSQLGSSLCAGTSFSVLAGNAIFYHQGAEGVVTVKYTVKGVVEDIIEDVFECTDDVLPYILHHGNWGIPLLPPIDGCPLLVFHRQRFYEKGQQWNCVI